MDYSIKGVKEHFKSKGIYYTPKELAEFIKSFIDVEYTTVYDPTCGRGSLLSVFEDCIHKYGQDIEEQAINYCCENIKNFTGFVGDTLTDDKFKDMKFDVIVANPPFSIKWDIGKIIKDQDDRFNKLPCLPPKSKADWGFMAHILNKLKEEGIAVVLNFPGILYRGAREKEIRKWFVDNNYIDRIVQVPGKKFTDTTIETSLVVLRKNKKHNSIKFTDMTTGVENEISKQEIINNDYNLSVSSYCYIEEVKEKIDPYKLELTRRKEVIKTLRSQLEMSKLVAELEGYDITEFLAELKQVVDEFE